MLVFTVVGILGGSLLLNLVFLHPNKRTLEVEGVIAIAAVLAWNWIHRHPLARRDLRIRVSVAGTTREDSTAA